MSLASGFRNTESLLFISHDASRTGAPFCLLHILRWLKENTNASFEILLRDPGPLQEEFAKLAPVWIHRHRESFSSLVGTYGLIGALKRRWWTWRDTHVGDPGCGVPIDGPGLLRRIRKLNLQLIYSNTVVNGDILRLLAPLNLPVISHIHELRNIIELFGPDNWRAVYEHTGFYIAASPAVKENLVKNYAVAPELVDVVYESLPTRDCVRPADATLKLRAKLNIAEGDFVVCGSGLDEWRKGTDLFIRCAEAVTRQTAAPISFVWVGGWLSERARLEHLDLARRLGVADCIRFTGMVDNPLDYFAAADVFALTSREDPFPLVCLEAAALGKPVICFAESGGMPDFVEDDAGFVVPREDVLGMAARIVQLADDRSLAKSLGERARAKVRGRHDVSVGAPQILGIIRRQLEQHGRKGCDSLPDER